VSTDFPVGRSALHIIPTDYNNIFILLILYYHQHHRRRFAMAPRAHEHNVIFYYNTYNIVGTPKGEGPEGDHHDVSRVME